MFLRNLKIIYYRIWETFQDLASFASIIIFSDSYRRPFKIYATCRSCSFNRLPAAEAVVLWSGYIYFCCFYVVSLLFCCTLCFFVGCCLLVLIWSDPMEETFVVGRQSLFIDGSIPVFGSTSPTTTISQWLLLLSLRVLHWVFLLFVTVLCNP